MSDEPAGPDAAEEPASGPDVETAYGVPVTTSRGQRVLHPDRAEYLDVARALKEDGYRVCVDVTAVDYLVAEIGRMLPPGIEAQRFEVVANFVNHADRSRVRVRVQVPGDDPTCPSLWPLHAGTENLEREAFDMFGITFDGHPDMTRILMPETWQGHPLRKDQPIGQIPVQFKGAPSAR